MEKQHQVDARERHLLRFSVWIALLFTVMGVIWGVAINSSIILFDGIYSGVSLILSLLSLVALRLVNLPRDDKFHFGRATFEPMVMALKSIVIIGVCFYGVIGASIDLVHGGAHVTSFKLGMLYGLVATTLCIISWLYLKTRGGDMPELVQAESEQWFIDTVFSGVTFLGFVISYFLLSTQYKIWVPYIDPLMVVAASAIFIRTPLIRLISSIREILQMAPDQNVQNDIRACIDRAVDSALFSDTVIRTVKIGRELFIDITFIVKKDIKKFDVLEQDIIREKVENSLLELDFKLYLMILFTKNKHWVKCAPV